MLINNLSNIYVNILKKFPQQFTFCFAYGSGVKKQININNEEQGHQQQHGSSLSSSNFPLSQKHVTQEKKMIDLLFCVNETIKWHKLNIEINPTHYSALKLLGSKCITKIQENYGAAVYCNTLIPLEDGTLIKYGVISEKDLLNDLFNWSHLYISGRLHKPVDLLHMSAATPHVSSNENKQNLQLALRTNLNSAIRTSLLLLPEQFTFYELFHKISNLSYAGDFRMIFGETKNKVKNIVTPQLNEFYKLYSSNLNEFQHTLKIPEFHPSAIITQDKSKSIILNHLDKLPNGILDRLIRKHKNESDRSKLFESIAISPKLPYLIQSCVNEIVWRSSVTQSIKNIPTAGFIKAVRYSWKKALRTFNL